MSVPVITLPTEGLRRLGLRISEAIRYQLPPEDLVRHCLRRKEGVLGDSGALVIRTGAFTGRSPRDRYIVRDEITTATVHWNDFNQPIDPAHFHRIFTAATNWLNRAPELFVRDCYVCADPRYRQNIRIINETPSGNLFAYNMFLRPAEEELDNFRPDWQILAAPGLALNPAECGTRSANAVAISFRHRLIVLAGTAYTGEIKKGIFSILNFLLPRERNVLSMHCSANKGPKGDTAIFFGLSGTGKTTLSADPDRRLIGDDEHGWSDDNIFNFEGGCYAKCIHLREDREPDIYQAIRPGALVENVRFFPGTDRINFDDCSVTENTRVSYPLSYISTALEPSVAAPPSNIFFLTCDAYGVLPPISRLSPGQAMYQFISGYTAKVAGTETGVTEPRPTFSACFGAPFLPLHPARYAELLGERIKRQGAKVWLVNTGWSGGPYGQGSRIQLSFTRSMITAALEGALDKVEYQPHPVFGMMTPSTCPGVAAELLHPRGTWPSGAAYDEMAANLARWFTANFEKYSADIRSPEILAAAPTRC
ncbi:MAG TPA: phosphoenolpyruvate carboxykinase (ATP) [Puia sp.]|nr:phosphoenolpyruvate carboxykinase (ATP) [Puia sp.]